MSEYFTGKRPSGYIVVDDPDLPGGKIELETRMCAHCGFHGIYKPGHAKKYANDKNFINGVCLKCMGLTCMKMECNTKCQTVEAWLVEQENIGKIRSL